MKTKFDSIISNRSDVVLIGLTGRTGSGCSVAAKLLNKPLSDKTFAIPGTEEGGPVTKNDIRKADIVKKYASKNWRKFEIIRVRDIITSFILEEDYSSLCRYLSDLDSTINFNERLSTIKDQFHTLNKKRKGLPKSIQEYGNNSTEVLESAYNFYWKNETLSKFTKEFKEILTTISPDKDLYTTLYQRIGNNIRSSGKAYDTSTNNTNENVDQIAKTIEQLLLTIKGRDKTKKFVVIDSLRNPFEILYFQERFSSFHCIAVNTDNDQRINRLSVQLNKDQINALDTQEYPSKFKISSLNSQDIQKCIEISDIHCNNPKDESGLHKVLNFQLFYYVSLMQKPGLVSPSDEERIMQLAYTAKLSSGCISRQVGAAIADKDYSVKAIGWNNTPKGQVPCSIRNVNDLIQGNDNEAYSNYERSDTSYRQYVKDVYDIERVKDYSNNGNNICYCFKELHNSLKGESNQVHTRSLHAEENAFLQVSKYGGQGIQNGILFSTASPCELCSKKAYQLGINKIVFIDPYPGIAKAHIIEGGTEADNPKFKLYSGAIGGAYFKLYNPIFSQKEVIKNTCGLIIVSPKKEVELLRIEVQSLKEKNAMLENQLGKE